MDWTGRIDGYCERLGPDFWAEPVNALTNLGFVLMALVMWRRCGGHPAARGLAAILGVIGIGSFLFHTYATVWAAILDVVPIAAFILAYVLLVHRDILRVPLWVALLAAALFLPYAALVGWVLRAWPVFALSSVYWSVPLLLAVYALALRRRLPDVARGFATGALVLALSIALRSMDAWICPAWPLGTHFLWHLLNALMLAYMIETYRRHIASAP